MRLGTGRSPKRNQPCAGFDRDEDSVTAFDAIAQADAFREAAAQDPNTRFKVRMV